MSDALTRQFARTAWPDRARTACFDCLRGVAL